MMLFTETGERAKAMGVYGFVASGGGTIGVLAGGVLTDVLNWHWIFLVNIPIGSRCTPEHEAASCRQRDGRRPARRHRRRRHGHGSLMLAVYAIVNGNEVGWGTGQTLGLLAASVVLLGAFLVIESRVSHPLMPLGLFKHRTLATANGVAVLLAGSMFAWFFLTALYLQLVLGYSPLQVGLAFLPSSLIMGAFSLGLSAKLVMRFGIKPPMVAGMLFMAAGLLLYARVPVDGSFVLDVLRARFSWASAPAWASTRSCSRRWETSSRPRRVSPPEWSTPRS